MIRKITSRLTCFLCKCIGNMEPILHNFARLINRKIINLNRIYDRTFKKITPVYDTEFLCNKENQEKILNNIKHRKGVGDILLVQKLVDQMNITPEAEKDTLQELIKQECSKLPNNTHPEVLYYDEPSIVKLINNKREFDFEPIDFGDIGRKLNILRTENLGALTGPKSYVFMDNLAQLERALIQYATQILIRNGFELVSVPDILPSSIIEACGMNTESDRNQIYRLKKGYGSNLCLSGTSEISMAGLLADSVVPVDKPLKLAAISRCFRAETSGMAQEKGIYRVHQFTKVEMFICCHPNKSSDILEEIVKIQEEIFSPLGIHIRQLDMPAHELGAPAYRKYDMEAWMPGRKMWGEISSCSNCTDYQACRLGIRYLNEKSEECFVHTLNGTACAVPRMLIALLETHQNKDGTITIPEPLVPFMRGCQQIRRRKRIPEIKLVKSVEKL